MERSWWLTVYAELVCALRNIAECVMPGMAVWRAGLKRIAVELRDANFMARNIRERLGQQGDISAAGLCRVALEMAEGSHIPNGIDIDAVNRHTTA